MLTLAALFFIPDSRIAALVLPVVWWCVFTPISPAELVQSAVAAIFFLFQNYVTLRAGLFVFSARDILLMPYYEPLLWGFYFLALKRFIGERYGVPALGWKAVAGLILTSVAFSLFAGDSRALLVATIGSTAGLLLMFHAQGDLAYAAAALVLGCIVELFGVWSGLWWYPAPDVLGLPYWFATMWVSAGLLGRRFLMPVAERVANRHRI